MYKSFVAVSFSFQKSSANTKERMESRNTQTTSTGIKTRSFGAIFSELQSALVIHKQNQSFLGGIHLELTGDPVTECLGGSQELGEGDLELNYTTFCDPRLNEKQALELAFLVAGSQRGSNGNSADGKR